MEYKYLKYKQKYLNLKKMNGGTILENDILKKIKSIGFEFETSDLFLLSTDNTNIIGRYNMFDISGNQIENGISKSFTLSNDAGTKPSRFISLFEENLLTYDNGSNIHDISGTYTVNSVPNLELNILFKDPPEWTGASNNIILKKFIKCCKKIRNVFKSYEQRIVNVVKNDDNFITNIFTNGKAILTYKKYLEAGENIEDKIMFTPQCTFGCALKDVADIIIYLAYDNECTETHSLKYYSKFRKFQLYSLQIINQLYNDISKTNNEEMLCIFIKHKKELFNWFFIVLCQAYFYSLYSQGGKLYKYHSYFILRHPIQHIFPCDDTFKKYIGTILGFKHMIFNTDIDKYKELFVIFSKYINVLFSDSNKNNDDEQMYFDNIKVVPIISRFYNYTKGCDILVEFRSFFYYLCEIYEKNEKISLSSICKVAEKKIPRRRELQSTD